MRKGLLLLPNELTQVQKEIIIGSMLGDGNLSISGINARLIIKRSYKDKKYLLWQLEQFKDFITDNALYNSSYLDKRTNKYYKLFTFITRCSSAFTPYYNEWYSSTKKSIPRNLELTRLIMLIWFLDDGCIVKINNTLKIKFATHNFSKNDVDFLCKLLHERYGTYFGPVEAAPNQYVIYGAHASACAFINDIGAWPSFMKRKVTWTKKELNIKPRKSKVLNPNIKINKLYKTLSAYSFKQSITTSELAFNMKVIDTRGKLGHDYFRYMLNKFTKQGLLTKIDPGPRLEKSYYLTKKGFKFFKSQTK